MERRAFGNTGLEVSVLGLGGAWIGDPRVSQDDVDLLVRTALDEGLNVVDTASVYGQSEEKLGKALQGRRNDVIVFTKGGEADDLPGEDWEPAVVAASLERSLTRLRTEWVDLFILHSCDIEVLRRGETIEAALRAKREGKTRFIAYSGDNEALEYALETEAFDVLMTSVNVADQANLPTLRRARRQGIGTVAKRPIANAAWAGEPEPSAYGRRYWERLRRLDYPAMDLSLALRWTLSQPVDVAVVGMTTLAQWRENLAVLRDGPLPEQACETIEDRWRKVAPSEWIGLT